jgi:hypothetical protein
VTPLRLLAVAGGAAGAAVFSVITWSASRAMREFDRTVNQALATVVDDPPPDPEAEHELWVLRLRRQAYADALDAAISRHPAGKKRPR